MYTKELTFYVSLNLPDVALGQIPVGDFMPFAVIDIGTNTVILLIAKLQKNSLKVLHDEAHITRLGKGLSENHFFDPTAMKRTIEVLKKYKEICLEHKVEKIEVIGTAAFRTAANSQVMLEKILTECDMKARIISGEEEAEAVFEAASNDFLKTNKKLLVIDIGGGSTEIILGPDPKNKPLALVSIPVGSVKLTEEYVHHDPITEQEFKKLLSFIQSELKDHLDSLFETFDIEECTLVATAGTATTVAAATLKMVDYDPTTIHGHCLKQDTLAKLIDKLVNCDLRTRQKMPGINPERADVIIAGSILLYEIMRYFKKESTLISDRGLRYGIFYRTFKSQASCKS